MSSPLSRTGPRLQPWLDSMARHQVVGGGCKSVKVNSWQRCKAERSGEDVAVTVRWQKEKKRGKSELERQEKKREKRRAPTNRPTAWRKHDKCSQN